MCWANATNNVNQLQQLARLHAATASACRLAAACTADPGGWRLLGRLGTQSDRFGQALMGQAEAIGGLDAPFIPPQPHLSRAVHAADCHNALDTFRLHRARLVQAYDRAAEHAHDPQTRALLSRQRAELHVSESEWATFEPQEALS